MIRKFFAVVLVCAGLVACGGGGGAGGGAGSGDTVVFGDGAEAPPAGPMRPSSDADVSGAARALPMASMGALEAV